MGRDCRERLKLVTRHQKQRRGATGQHRRRAGGTLRGAEAAAGDDLGDLVHSCALRLRGLEQKVEGGGGGGGLLQGFQHLRSKDGRGVAGGSIPIQDGWVRQEAPPRMRLVWWSVSMESRETGPTVQGRFLTSMTKEYKQVRGHLAGPRDS